MFSQITLEPNIPTMVWSRQEMICGTFRHLRCSVIPIKCYSKPRDVDSWILVWFMFLANFCERLIKTHWRHVRPNQDFSVKLQQCNVIVLGFHLTELFLRNDHFDNLIMQITLYLGLAVSLVSHSNTNIYSRKWSRLPDISHSLLAGSFLGADTMRGCQDIPSHTIFIMECRTECKVITSCSTKFLHTKNFWLLLFDFL